MPEFDCPHCGKTIHDQYHTAFILLPRIDSVRYHTIAARANIARIETLATIYQPQIRRLCGEADHHLTHTIGAIRSIIEHARHHHHPPQPQEKMPEWW